jgi:hypothetical protein
MVQKNSNRALQLVTGSKTELLYLAASAFLPPTSKNTDKSSKTMLESGRSYDKLRNINLTDPTTT